MDGKGNGTAFQDVAFNQVVVPGTLVSGASPLTSYSFALGTATGSDTVSFDGRNDPNYNFLTNVVVTETAVPEPASLALLGVGLTALGFVRRKRA